MTALELKPCPFCGGEAVFEHPIIEAVVWCRSCHAKVTRSANPLTHSYENGRKIEAAGVVSAWNTRADPCIRRDDPALVQVMEALEKEIKRSRRHLAKSTFDALAAVQELIGGKDG